MEALERARAAYGTGAYDDATIEFLFPEVKESEDERTRKEIVDFIRWAIDRGSITKEQRERSDTWLAYLEKQKEQQPAEGTALQKAFISSKINFTLEEKCDASDYAEVILPTSVAYGEDDEEYKLHKIIEAAFIAGQKKEQKPAEWSEDYREEDLRTRFAFYTYKDEDDVLYLSNVFVEETSRNKGFGTKILAAAEKVAETLGVIIIRLKVKQNSSANAWYRKHGYSFMAFEDDYDWLEKTLEYMKPVKQARSDEDKENFEWFDKFFRAESVIAGGKDIPQDKYLWFKSLRPQPNWKPSEEQLDAVRYVSQFDYGGHKAILVSLYEQLKKL